MYAAIRNLETNGGLVMKKTIMVGLGLIALMAPPVVAAERPVLKAPPPPPAPVSTWTGCYFGFNIGLVGSDTKVSWGGVPDVGHSADAAAGGGQIGCDYQLASNWVIGIQGLYDGTNIGDTHSPVIFASTPCIRVGDTPPCVLASSNVKWFATIAARIGYAISESLLLYGKFGWGYYNNHFNVVDPHTGYLFGAVSRTQGGFDLGIGGEFLFPSFTATKSFLPQSLWVEYDHIFPHDTTLFLPNLVNPLTGVAPETARIRRDFNKLPCGLQLALRHDWSRWRRWRWRWRRRRP